MRTVGKEHRTLARKDVPKYHIHTGRRRSPCLELCHSMQDFEKYNNVEDPNYLIEMSNEAKTILELSKIINNPYLKIESFDFDININVDQFTDYLQYYYQIDSPLNKALYWLKVVLDIKEDINRLLMRDSDTVILSLKDLQNNTVISNPIIVNSTYTHYTNIMSVLSVILMNKIYKVNDKINIGFYKINDLNNTLFIDINIDINKLFSPIVYLPNGIEPIEKIEII